MRAVLDPNVLISALLSPRGTPARVLVGWQEGRYEMVVSPGLLGELEHALSYPKLRKHVTAEEASRFVTLLRKEAIFVADPPEAPGVPSEDPADDYLIALAEFMNAALVSGDRHLLALSEAIPAFSPADFLSLITRRTRGR